MKMNCPICTNGGLLQQSGNGYRIQHYQGFIDGKGSYLYHRIDNAIVRSMEVKDPKTSFLGENKWTQA